MNCSPPHPRRLTAEELRDGILKITGELNTEMGGVFIQPEINMEVALQPRMIQFSIAPAYQPSPRPEQRNRRSIYAYRVRGQADPFLEIFNQPNRMIPAKRGTLLPFHLRRSRCSIAI